MVHLQLPTELLKLIYNNVSSKAMELRSILIVIENDKLILKHVNEMNSALLKIESTALNSGLDGIELPIDVNDLKTVVNLAKDASTVTFVIDAGVTTCKIGKIKKQFAQPQMSAPPKKEPNFATTTSVEFDDQQSSELISALSTLVEGDLRLMSSTESLIFKVSEENKYTSVEFNAADLPVFKVTDGAVAGYDLDMSTAIFKTKQKGSTFLLEFGADMPMKVTQTTQSGTVTTILAPKIYD
jgi:hypothetical protein